MPTKYVIPICKKRRSGFKNCPLLHDSVASYDALKQTTLENLKFPGTTHPMTASKSRGLEFFLNEKLLNIYYAVTTLTHGTQ
jgi:hypothetical protein